ncbi:aminoglycoside phosphotransferase family protein [Actinokineospora sp. NBRC 105648]|uniref:aminoglycoside phosphotransferase family protein n=1 Tax=Actinokineospora sp. NBRC 105648 TaxID=3032206 RepID=UPI0025522779|nr:aminoglycoside phosphotransferase family protein [Actinokineospora sp. NBRC 105648]
MTTQRATEFQRMLTAACGQVGLDPTDAELITYSSNAVYRLPRAHVVVRLNPHAGNADQTRVLVHTARWLQTAGAPVAPLTTGLDQPVIGPDWAATFWTELRPAHRPGYADLAHPLRAIHTVTPAAHLPVWNKFAYARHHLAQARGVDDTDLEWLTSAWDQAELDYQAIAANLTHGVVHGDAHPGNLLRTHDGHLVLCDLDNVAIGPLDWDLTPTAVSATRFANETDHHDFTTRYGRDVTNTDGWPVLKRIRELVMTTYLVPDLANRPALKPQWKHRLDTLRHHHDHALWQRF